MIKFEDLIQETPYLIFKENYEKALKANQKNIEAISISSYSNEKKEVNSRYVNLKLVNERKFIFFSNYNSPKSKEFENHNQITALIYWNNTNIQIRMKAFIEKTSKDFNQSYFSLKRFTTFKAIKFNVKVIKKSKRPKAKEERVFGSSNS